MKKCKFHMNIREIIIGLISKNINNTAIILIEFLAYEKNVTYENVSLTSTPFIFWVSSN